MPARLFRGITHLGWCNLRTAALLRRLSMVFCGCASWIQRQWLRFFPSDHHFGDDAGFVAQVNLAFEAAKSGSEPVVLMGITPSHPEVEYGWIQPGAALTGYASVFHVSSFWEKPTLALASQLMDQGCLWNSFVMVGRVDSFLHLIRGALPNLVRSFESIQPAFFTGAEREALLDLYSGMPASDFSDGVLSAHCGDLAVLPAGNLDWSDLGDAARVLSVLERKGVQPEWATGTAKERRLMNVAAAG